MTEATPGLLSRLVEGVLDRPIHQLSGLEPMVLRDWISGCQIHENNSYKRPVPNQACDLHQTCRRCLLLTLSKLLGCFGHSLSCLGLTRQCHEQKAFAKWNGCWKSFWPYVWRLAYHSYDVLSLGTPIRSPNPGVLFLPILSMCYYHPGATILFFLDHRFLRILPLSIRENSLCEWQLERETWAGVTGRP